MTPVSDHEASHGSGGTGQKRLRVRLSGGVFATGTSHAARLPRMIARDGTFIIARHGSDANARARARRRT